MKKYSIGYLLVAICSRGWSLTLLSVVIALLVGLCRHWGSDSFSTGLMLAYSIWGGAIGLVVSFPDFSPNYKLLGIIFPPLVMVGAAISGGLLLGWGIQMILMVGLAAAVLGLLVKKIPALFNL